MSNATACTRLACPVTDTCEAKDAVECPVPSTPDGSPDDENNSTTCALLAFVENDGKNSDKQHYASCAYSSFWITNLTSRGNFTIWSKRHCQHGTWMFYRVPSKCFKVDGLRAVSKGS